MKKLQDFRKWVKGRDDQMALFIILFGVLVVVLLYFKDNVSSFLFKDKSSKTEYTEISGEDDYNRIENGVHVRTGLIDADGLTLVVNNCTYCHSAELVMQNRMDKESWIATIRWMQRTQNLRDLGEDEEIIINYLVTNYPPIEKGRRAVLSNIEWYKLKE